MASSVHVLPFSGRLSKEMRKKGCVGKEKVQRINENVRSVCDLATSLLFFLAPHKSFGRIWGGETSVVVYCNWRKWPARALPARLERFARISPAFLAFLAFPSFSVSCVSFKQNATPHLL
eukprot:g61039.t1